MVEAVMFTQIQDQFCIAFIVACKNIVMTYLMQLTQPILFFQWSFGLHYIIWSCSYSCKCF